MVSWLLRGLPLAAVHIVVRVLLGMAIVHSPLNGNWWKTIAVAVVVIIPLIWAGIDGIADARAHDDPDDYEDLTMRWLKAGLLAGVIAGVVGWALANYAFAGMGQNSFLIELFAGGSFTALLVFIPAMVGASVGRFLVRRQRRREQRDDSEDTRPSLQKQNA
ncbi:B-4DMT family transporter [uncultured Williamsia sp.]|uniref:B-4DMT family transporter n=1 Tax=uncultured Williamsia sp. TaxID=259311 RepID=UPI002639625C|nr:B-4DMT family transporter [uncultured Williamsia sp.]